MNELVEIKGKIRELQRLPKAFLGTIAQREDAHFPFVSLVMPALDAEGCPLLLLSDLSDHVRNLRADTHASLLFDGTEGREEPLTGPRLTLIGDVAPTAAAADRAAYLARHPSAAAYAAFADFRCYRFQPREALLVAGFGRIHRLVGADLLGAIKPEM